ncbi:cytochrome c peroxidase [Thermogutta sp.]|uniref:YVTN family beta-propeller repeat protein n=1 Tax=Thermogutta sp. TaxID=1962930 RepID=UPI0032209433
MLMKGSDIWVTTNVLSKQIMSLTKEILGLLWLVAVLFELQGIKADTSWAEETSGRYLGPWQVRATPDGASVFVLCKDAARIAVIDVASQQVTRWINTPADPHDFLISPDAKVIYIAAGVSNGIVAELKSDDGAQIRQISVGHTPGGLALSKENSRLFVCNRFDNTVSIIDLVAGREEKRLAVTREPVAAALTPDEKRLFVANLLPLDRCDSYDVAAVVSSIDTLTFEVHPIRLPNGSTDVHGLAISPDGKWVYVVHVLSRYQMPTTQLERGWMNTNALTIIDVQNERVLNTVLLDDVDLGAALPWAVVCSADGQKLVVSHASTDEISVIDIPAVLEKLKKLPPTPEAAQAAGVSYDGSQTSLSAVDVPNDLSFLVGLKERIPLYGLGPYDYLSADSEKIVKGARGLALVGSKVFVATYFGDLVTVVDLKASKYQRLSYVSLGPKPILTQERLGELYFHDASLCFQHWQSCATCHPDGRVDGLNWDLLNDGLGTPKNNKSLLLAHQTPPAMWEGVRANAEEAVRSGIRHIQFAVRPEEDAQAIDAYLKSLRPVPSPHLVNGQLSESARRGRELFFSERLKCHHCHPEPLYTDLKKHNVGSRGPLDRSGEFDTPTLIEVWRTAPYLHDGHYLTLEELFRDGKHGETAGSDVRSLTEQELHDLCEFVRSL